MKLKTKEEIQEAHDFLHAVIEHNESLPAEDRIPDAAYFPLHSAHDAISWVLGFQCGQQFAKNMEELRKELDSAGFKLVKYKSHSE